MIEELHLQEEVKLIRQKRYDELALFLCEQRGAAPAMTPLPGAVEEDKEVKKKKDMRWQEAHERYIRERKEMYAKLGFD